MRTVGMGAKKPEKMYDESAFMEMKVAYEEKIAELEAALEKAEKELEALKVKK